MKNIFIGVGLLLALMSVNQIWAQDEPVDSNKSEISISLDSSTDDVDAQESLERVADLVRDIAGDDVAGEVLVELEGLSASEKAELVDALRKGAKIKKDNIPGWVGVVAILGVILIFGTPILVLIAVFVYIARKRRQKMNIIQVYLDAGKDVPPELLRTFDNGGNSFRSGLTLTFIGLGILFAFSAANASSVGALGLIPMFIGISKLLYWYVEERKLNNN